MKIQSTQETTSSCPIQQNTERKKETLCITITLNWKQSHISNNISQVNIRPNTCKVSKVMIWRAYLTAKVVVVVVASALSLIRRAPGSGSWRAPGRRNSCWPASGSVRCNGTAEGRISLPGVEWGTGPSGWSPDARECPRTVWEFLEIIIEKNT